MSLERVVCLNCIDGRAQLPVFHWIKKNYDVEYVDMITEPGMDGTLSDPQREIEGIITKLNISITKNRAALIFIAGHYDCRGNPVDDTQHQDQIRLAVKRIRQEFDSMGVIGLWQDENSNIHDIAKELA